MPIRNIKAAGIDIEVELDNGKKIYLTREQALERAQAITGLGRHPVELQQAIIKACDDSHKNQFGHGYTSQLVAQMLTKESVLNQAVIASAKEETKKKLPPWMFNGMKM